MTFLHALVFAGVSLLVGAGGGWYAKGKYAAKAQAELVSLSKKM